MRHLLIACAVSVAALVAPTLAGAACGLSGAGTSDDPYRVSSKSTLAMVGVGDCGLNKHYLQTADITWVGGAFTPIASDLGLTSAFSGTYDGGGHSIIDLQISSPASRAGMFASIDGATIERLELRNAVVEGVAEDDSGILVGFAATYSAPVVIRDVHITGASSITTANDYIGAIVGYGADDGLGGTNAITIADSSSSATVTGGASVGGIAGKLELGIAGSSVLRVRQTGAVHGAESNVGGLIGSLSVARDGVALGDSYSTGAVSADITFAGGVIGEWSNGLITPPTGTVRRVYATGVVTAAGIGIGGAGIAGGLFGSAFETVLDSFYDRQTSGLNDFSDSAKTTAQMKDIATYAAAGWGIAEQWATPSGAKAWGICADVNDGYPFLLSDYSAPGPCAREDIELKVVRTFVGRGGLGHAPAPRAAPKAGVTVRWSPPSDAPAGTTYTLTWRKGATGTRHAIDVGTATRASFAPGSTGDVILSVESSHGNSSVEYTLAAKALGRPIYLRCTGPWQALCSTMSTATRVGRVTQVATFLRSGTRAPSAVCRGSATIRKARTAVVCRLSNVGKALLRRGPIVVRMTTTVSLGAARFVDSTTITIPRIGSR